MKTAALIAASMLAATSAAADPLERLRNASANELCWDTVRGFAREKYPSLKTGDPELTQVSFTRPTAQASVRENRKAFVGIRNC